MAVPETWDLIATPYEAEVMPLLEGYARDALVLADPPRNARVIDVACGPGTLAMLAAHAGHTVDAIDFSPAMIAALSARIGNFRANVTARVGDGQALPYDDGTFHTGFSMFGLFMFPDRAAGFRELRRVLVRGGKAVVSSWQPLERTPMFQTIFSTLSRVLAAASGQPAAAQPPPLAVLATAAECRAEMGAAFGDVVVHEVTHRTKFASADAAWESTARTLAPVALLAKRLPPQIWGMVDAELRAAVRQTMGEGPVELAMPALLSVGTAT